ADTFKMTLSKKGKFYENTTDSNVIEDILATYGIDAEVQNTNITHNHLVQYDCTDWDFMLNRLDVNNKICITELNKVKILKPTMTGSSVLNLVFGGTILDLDLETDARLQHSTVSTQHWNIDDQEITLEDIDNPNVPMAGNIDANNLSGTGDQ